MDQFGHGKPVSAARIDLRDVTLCAADSLNPALAAGALDRSIALCEFGDAILFSHRQVAGQFRCVSIPALRSSHDYSTFMLKHLAPHIRTPFVLVVQWDGFVTSPEAWTPEFRGYDYIGAAWPWHTDHRVGNGGFSLRSAKLLGVVAQLLPDIPDMAEDELICRVMRPILETDLGIRFAPEAVADRFSYERSVPGGPTFGFHGLFNLWRHLDDAAMVHVAGALHANAPLTAEYVECVIMCCLQQRTVALRALFSRWRSRMDAPAVRTLMSRYVAEADLVAHCCRIGEALIR